MKIKSAFITGADRGLGYALCLGLLQQGWKVFAGQYIPEWAELADLSKLFPKFLEIVPLNIQSTVSVAEAAAIISQNIDSLDLLVNNAGITFESDKCTIRQPQEYADIHTVFDVNALGATRVTEAFLPLLDQGSLKRLCFISSEAGSISHSWRKTNFGYCMSKAALNMAISIMFNSLRPEGYTFRVYHPGYLRSFMHGSKNKKADLEPEDAAMLALPYFLNDLQNEDRLALIDNRGREIAW